MTRGLVGRFLVTGGMVAAGDRRFVGGSRDLNDANVLNNISKSMRMIITINEVTNIKSNCRCPPPL